jgi:hypothetical protein
MTGATEDLDQLQHRASALSARAEALAQAYQRSTWIRFLGVYIPIPFVVVLFRLQIEAWGYYLAGAFFILSAAVLYAIDSAQSGKVDAATKAAEQAQKEYEQAARRGLTTG